MSPVQINENLVRIIALGAMKPFTVRQSTHARNRVRLEVSRLKRLHGEFSAAAQQYDGLNEYCLEVGILGNVLKLAMVRTTATLTAMSALLSLASELTRRPV